MQVSVFKIKIANQLITNGEHVSKKRKIKLPDNLGKLLLPKDGNIEKLKKRYSGKKKFSFTSVMTSDGKPLGFLLRKIDLKEKNKSV